MQLITKIQINNKATIKIAVVPIIKFPLESIFIFKNLLKN